uniref:Uncharacterized protein n=1 Tax=Rhizophora mucronata TaxID=61149 RepID=A0A2P2IUQ2_RHIMU
MALVVDSLEALFCQVTLSPLGRTRAAAEQGFLLL